MKILIAFLFYLFYWFCCFLGTGTDRKNLAGLRSYHSKRSKNCGDKGAKGIE